ncbi:MAG: hypothetical protein JNL38_16290 [Myxococcales bacterium]|nr:hypothetical protein [Myxococcales bacterium]
MSELGGPKDDVVRRWWPLARGMDLVRAPADRVAALVASELERSSLPFERRLVHPASLEEVFATVPSFTNVPTTFFVLPGLHGWTVIWNNSFLCDGYDSLAYNLTRLHGVDTLHFTSSDTDGPMLAGTSFTWRDGAAAGEPSRSVHCASGGLAWSFHATGRPLPGEDLAVYASSPVRARLDEEKLSRLLATMGAAPWREAFYDFTAPIQRLDRIALPSSITSRPIGAILGRGAAAEATGELPEGPPEYVRAHVHAPRWDGPAALLRDGSWCGHGEPAFSIFDVREPSGEGATVELPVAPAERGAGAPLVRVGHVIAYDARHHPASSFETTSLAAPTRPFACPRCAGARFHAAVGFEIPADAGSNVDTTWFAIAIECVACAWSDLVWEDETA